MTHWDMFNKATKFEFSLFKCPSASFALQFGDLYKVIAQLQKAYRL